MGFSYYFAEAPAGSSEVLAWLRSAAQGAEETVTDYGVVLFFKDAGPIILDEQGRPDGAKSPVVTVMLPQTRRSILKTTGAVHFLSSPMSRFPSIAKLHRDFKAWMVSHPLVYDPRKGAENPYGYYLLGGAANRGAVYGLPTAIDALHHGQYFVDPLDNTTVLDTVCRILRLRGLECQPS